MASLSHRSLPCKHLTQYQPLITPGMFESMLLLRETQCIWTPWLHPDRCKCTQIKLCCRLLAGLFINTHENTHERALAAKSFCLFAVFLPEELQCCVDTNFGSCCRALLCSCRTPCAVPPLWASRSTLCPWRAMEGVRWATHPVAI